MDSEQVTTNEKVEEGEKVVEDAQPQENTQVEEKDQVPENKQTTENQSAPENEQIPQADQATENNQAEQEKAVEQEGDTAQQSEKTEESQQVADSEKAAEGTQTIDKDEATEEKVEEATQTIEKTEAPEEKVDESTQTLGNETVKEEEKTDEGTQTAGNEKVTETVQTSEVEKTSKETATETEEAGEPQKAVEEQKSEETGPSAEYAKIIGEAKKLYDEVLPISQWEYYGEKNGIKSYTRTDQATGIKMVRGEGTINKQASKFWEVVLDPARIKNWENNLVSHQKVEQIGDYEVYRSLDQKRMFVTQRETLIATKVYKQDDGTVLIIQRSCNHPAFPEVKDFVRAAVNLFVWQFVPDKENENITQATCILYIDIKGWVPTALFNTFVSDQAQNVLKLKNYVEKAF